MFHPQFQAGANQTTSKVVITAFLRTHQPDGNGTQLPQALPPVVATNPLYAVPGYFPTHDLGLFGASQKESQSGSDDQATECPTSPSPNKASVRHIHSSPSNGILGSAPGSSWMNWTPGHMTGNTPGHPTFPATDARRTSSSTDFLHQLCQPPQDKILAQIQVTWQARGAG